MEVTAHTPRRLLENGAKVPVPPTVGARRSPANTVSRRARSTPASEKNPRRLVAAVTDAKTGAKVVRLATSASFCPYLSITNCG